MNTQILSKLKQVSNFAFSSMNIGYKIIKGIDYKTLNQYVLKINQYKDINRILYETSSCLEEILDYELFGFAVRHEASIDVWIDPAFHSLNLSNIISADFGCQNNDLEMHYFDDKNTKNRQMTDNFIASDILSYTVLDDKYAAKLYIMPRRKMLHYHDEIINIIVKTLGGAIETSLDMKKLEDAAAIDHLTGCYNRRALNSYLKHELAYADRYGTDLTVIMFDLDYFKKINDTHGHRAGDAVLEEICKLTASLIRKSDHFARYGGEEFTLVLPNTGIANATGLAEKIRKAIEGLSINLPLTTIKVTASFGVAALEGHPDGHSLLHEADQMLYKAKLAGRNTVSYNNL